MQLSLNRKLFIAIWSIVFVKVLLSGFIPLTGDEEISMSIIFGSKTLEDMFQILYHHDTQMPLFYLISYFLRDFDLVRLPWILLSGVTVSLPLLFNLKGRRWVYFVILLSVGYFGTRHAINFRPYSLVLFGSTFFLCLLEKRKESQKVKPLYIFICLILLFLTHYYCMLLIAAYFLMEVFKKESFFSLRQKAALFFGMLLISLPFIPKIYTDFHAIHNYRTSPDIIDVLKACVLQFNGGLGTILAGGICLSYFSEFRKVLVENKEYVFIIFFGYVTAYLKSVLSAPAFDGAYFIYLAPFSLLLFCEILSKTNKEKPLFYLSILVAVLFNIKDIFVRLS